MLDIRGSIFALTLAALGLVTIGLRRAYRHLCQVRMLTAIAEHSCPVNDGPLLPPGLKFDRVETVANPDGTFTTTMIVRPAEEEDR